MILWLLLLYLDEENTAPRTLCRLWLECSIRIRKQINYLIHVKTWIGFRQLSSVSSSQYHHFFALSIFRNCCLHSTHSVACFHLRGGKRKKEGTKETNLKRTSLMPFTYSIPTPPRPFWSCNNIDCSFFLPPPPSFFSFFSLKDRHSVFVFKYISVYFPKNTIQPFMSSQSSQN